jgi:hypothetical protein
MNKAIVISDKNGSVTFIECESNAQAVRVYDAILKKNKDVAFYINITIIFSDGSIKHSHVNSYADPSLYLESTEELT